MHYLVVRLNRRLRRRKRLIVATATLILLGLGIFALTRPRSSGRKSVDVGLVEEIGSHILLPDEVPTIATVSDVSLLADQPFFAHAKNGDKVLLFRVSNKAVLYDPEAKKVLEMGSLDSTDATGSP